MVVWWWWLISASCLFVATVFFAAFIGCTASLVSGRE